MPRKSKVQAKAEARYKEDLQKHAKNKMAAKAALASIKKNLKQHQMNQKTRSGKPSSVKGEKRSNWAARLKRKVKSLLAKRKGDTVRTKDQEQQLRKNIDEKTLRKLRGK